MLERDSLASAALFEHRFWLQILGDHARFIYFALSDNETEELGRAHNFIDIFDSLLHQARRDPNTVDLNGLNRTAWQYALQLREFKLHLLRRHLTGRIQIHLPPSFL